MSKEAMKLALEALEKCDSALAEELAAWDIDPPLHHVLEASNACGPAITALRKALAEQPATKAGELYAMKTELWKQPAQQCWKCGDMDAAFQEKCNVPACGMKEQPAFVQQYQHEFPLRGILASELKCWHRLREEEAANLVAFVQNIPAKPAQQEPVALKWQQSPIRTAWGDDMVVASVAIDNDHTLSLYCERDQTPKVDAMFAQRTWVGLTDEEANKIYKDGSTFGEMMRMVEAKLKEKNT